MDEPIILSGFLITVLTAIGTGLTGALGVVWFAWQKSLDKKDEVVNLYHEDSKLNTIALNALTDWIKERRP